MTTMAMAALLAEKDVLARLKADAGVTGLVPAAQIYEQDPDEAPVWPFIKPTAPQGLPLEAACVKGSTVNFGLSGFSRGRWEDDALVETARDHCARIGDAIEKCIRGTHELSGVGTVTYRIGDMLMRVDGAEPGAFHYSCSVRARVLAEPEPA